MISFPPTEGNLVLNQNFFLLLGNVRLTDRKFDDDQDEKRHHWINRAGFKLSSVITTRYDFSIFHLFDFEQKTFSLIWAQNQSFKIK